MSFVEAAIRRLSPLRRGNLQRRLIERVRDAQAEECAPSRKGPPDGAGSKVIRAEAMLGRFSALTAGLEVR